MSLVVHIKAKAGELVPENCQKWDVCVTAVAFSQEMLRMHPSGIGEYTWESSKTELLLLYLHTEVNLPSTRITHSRAAGVREWYRGLQLGILQGGAAPYGGQLAPPSHQPQTLCATHKSPTVTPCISVEVMPEETWANR